MHASVHEFFRNHTTGEMFRGVRVIEVGSLDVNGSVRGHVTSFEPSEYIGIDFVGGRGVDRVMNAEKLTETYGRNSFDTVVSTEMLEHAEHWRECVNNMKDICKRWLIITTRGPGFPLHSYPDDWWRYTVPDMERIFADFRIHVLMDDPGAPGVLMVAEKTRRKRVDLTNIDLAPAPKHDRN